MQGFEGLHQYLEEELQSIGALLLQCKEAVNNDTTKALDVSGAQYPFCPLKSSVAGSSFLINHAL